MTVFVIGKRRIFYPMHVLPLDDPVIKKTIELKRAVKIKLPDAVIAATCLVNDLGLLIRNMKDFDDIQNLIVSNPFSEEFAGSNK